MDYFCCAPREGQFVFFDDPNDDVHYFWQKRVLGILRSSLHVNNTHTDLTDKCDEEVIRSRAKRER